jgi:hypothetical protein
MNVVAGPHMAILPMFVLILLFIGFVFLLIKAPKAAAALIGVVVVLFVSLFYVRSRSVSVATESPAPAVSWQVQEAARAPIWSEAVQSEFEADLYPSKASAARALGERMIEPIRRMTTDANETGQIVLFEQDGDRDVAAEFKRGMEQKSPGMGARCSIEAAWRNINPGEIGVTFGFQVRPIDNPVRDWPAMLGRNRVRNGEILATASAHTGRKTSAAAQFISKPWIEDFAAFASERPREQYVVARSVETCTSANDARRQALEDARQQLDRMVGARRTTPGRPPVTVTTKDVQEGGFITDTFVQSFDGSAGKIWRQAMLIDVSAPKLAWLTNRTIGAAQTQRLTWARQIGSAVGVLVLILVTYFFLNMATRGYYEWSLRIAGIVLAVIAIVVFLA